MHEILELINKMSPYLLLGFLLAGIMHVFVPTNLYRTYLSKNDFASVLRAALFGLPLPLCSCGVIPTAMSLRREGASKGATVSFLIATPQTGIDSILATYSLMGLPFAILRPIVAFITALFGGQLVNIFNKEEHDKTIVQNSAINEKKDTLKEKSIWKLILAALRYGFVDLIQDIGKWLLIGLFIAGLITVLVPDSFFALFSDSPLMSYLLVLLFSIPMYMCATGSIPIAVALILKGLSPGAALVLLMAGPASSMASIFVINKVLGQRTLLLYLLAIITGAVSVALFIDYILPEEWFTTSINHIETYGEHSTQYIGIICSVLLLILIINAFVLRFCKNRKHKEKEYSTTQHTIKKYKIEGMRCNHCRNNVEKAISSLSGVVEVQVDLDNAIAIVEGNILESEIISVIETLGFKVCYIKEN